jgi:hypothetical protein
MSEQRRLTFLIEGQCVAALAFDAIPNVAEVISKPFSRDRGILSNFDKLWSEREHSQWPDWN